MAKVRDVRKALKALDPDSHVAVVILTKDELEKRMEVSMTDEVWRLAITDSKVEVEDEAISLLRQACWDAEYDLTGSHA